MTSYQILRAAGYPPEEASRISGMPIPREDTVAGRNEAKYADDRAMSAEDRLTAHLMRGHATSDRYAAIRGMAGSNGECSSRKTTWRRHKFGKGNVGPKGWMESGFEQNRKRP